MGEKGGSLMEILELQARAKAIKAYLKAEGSKNEAGKPAADEDKKDAGAAALKSEEGNKKADAKEVAGAKAEKGEFESDEEMSSAEKKKRWDEEQRMAKAREALTIAEKK